MCYQVMRRVTSHLTIVSYRRLCSFGTGSLQPRIFDGATKQMQRDRSARSPDYESASYLKDEFGYRLSDRVFDIKRKFNHVVNLGCGRGHVAKHLNDDVLKTITLCDSSSTHLEKTELPEGNVTVKKLLLSDEEFKVQHLESQADLVISSLGLHWVNDLPNCFKNVIDSLVDDGVFMGNLFGGETLFELRCALQLAETEIRGGFSPRISPFTQPNDIGGLLQKAGFNMITIDADEIVVNYPSIVELMKDLRTMGESNGALNRKLTLTRNTISEASKIYRQMYGNKEDSSIPATFQVFSFIGWKPHESQPKPLQRGSANFSLKDINNLDKVLQDKSKK